jgi:predicted dehydrogenase
MRENGSIGVAVIGAGMAGKAHAAAYRMASALYSPVLPAIRLVSIADVNAEVGSLAARRFGYERSDTSWEAIAAADDIDVVSVVIANTLHRAVVEGLLAAGKHVLCEKPLSDTLEDGRAMADTARIAPVIARLGFTFWRTPGIAYIRELVGSGVLGKVLHFSGRYWTDYGCSPRAPISWRYKGGPGSGALADVGSHLAYVAEFICGPMTSISGGRLSTVIGDRPKPLGHVIGHEHVEVSDEYEKVENDDYAAFSAEFENGAGALQVSRVAAGHPNGLALEVFCENGAARFDQERPAEIALFLSDGSSAQNGYRQVILGPEHPYLAGGLPMDAPGVGFGQNDAFAYQARAFLEEVAGIDETSALPRCATFDEGVHNMELLAAVTKSALAGGKQVAL